MALQILIFKSCSGCSSTPPRQTEQIQNLLMAGKKNRFQGLWGGGNLRKKYKVKIRKRKNQTGTTKL